MEEVGLYDYVIVNNGALPQGVCSAAVLAILSSCCRMLVAGCAPCHHVLTLLPPLPPPPADLDAAYQQLTAVAQRCLAGEVGGPESSGAAGAAAAAAGVAAVTAASAGSSGPGAASGPTSPGSAASGSIKSVATFKGWLPSLPPQQGAAPPAEQQQVRLRMCSVYLQRHVERLRTRLLLFAVTTAGQLMTLPSPPSLTPGPVAVSCDCRLSSRRWQQLTALSGTAARWRL